MPVADASPLIYLAKTKRLYLLKELYGLVKITPSIYQEVVVKGEEKGFEDAIRVKKEIGGYIVLCSPREDRVEEIRRDSINLGFKLGSGELECITLCIDADDKIFLSDDDDAKEFAKNYGIDGRGTIYLLLKSYEKGFFNKNECAETFEKMIDKGFWVNPGVIKVFYKTLEKIRKL